MAQWIIRIPYSGVASIAIESDKKPDSDYYRGYLQAMEFDPGIPQFKSMSADIKKAKGGEFRGIKKIMDKRAKNKRSFLEYLDQKVN